MWLSGWLIEGVIDGEEGCWSMWLRGWLMKWVVDGVIVR